ncbi:hypothetical protein BLA60_06315 [Actinophytocola xinjiangensis]|uniref:Uncharacterized protein n=1 Tax=Actinophytocola xinjiangensis TaxID=485602 RepID=A0A7Z0WTD5_9PSEU|nr:hypothetical protein [Actinophytocola xinjiangensis]OLF12874.1 hypothetical protein BLA60_06315 [Actinophytocola xinjiangensis]
MHASLFSLIPVDNPEQIFAWGMEIITSEDPETSETTRKTIVYIHNSNDTGTLAQHTSAEAACARWSQIVPVDIVWDSDVWAAAYRSSVG